MRYFLLFLFFSYSLFGLEVKETYVQSSDNVQLFCRILGEGKPLIIIHGGPGLSQDYLLPHMHELAKDNFVIFYDQRAGGKSTGEINEKTINIPAFLKDLEAIRKAFNFQKISILGHSWGGLVAMHYAIEHSNHLEKLILSNSMPANTWGIFMFMNEWTKRMKPHMEEIDAIRNSPGYLEGDPELNEQWLRILFRNYCYKPESAELLNLKLEKTAASNFHKIHDIFKRTVLLNAFNLIPSLKKLTIPTLIIHGKQDIVPLSNPHSLIESIKSSKGIFIDHCGHFPFVEQPRLYFQNLREFLNNPPSKLKFSP